ncbi:MAG: hypothetical protein SFT94_05145 [Pseudanabaenaceae cyanobacterium bins.68]|nr:hypothetical protein [Pseudanabaenaceae cyanobacterium bins.68]
MTNTPPTLTYTLEEVLSRFEQKVDRQFTEINQKLTDINQKIDRQFAEVNQRLNKLEIGQTELSGEMKALDQKLTGEMKALDQKLTGEFKALDQKLTGEIKTLDEKVGGISKRIDNQEFISRGILVSVIIALIGGAAKLFEILPLNKN